LMQRGTTAPPLAVAGHGTRGNVSVASTGDASEGRPRNRVRTVGLPFAVDIQPATLDSEVCAASPLRRLDPLARTCLRRAWHSLLLSDMSQTGGSSPPTLGTIVQGSVERCEIVHRGKKFS